ncbi:anthranilate phosphoribosyltransferase [Longimicrobium terrae]|uniref:Anthranilate phosphoribosyltransferase n=1 Tax=Longimicrobium terrae TaxID=1639882 RepID=A0A841H647_9BACT|nr:anthranilate phosphoribosyltransferase [Longimicrobium terrae]MBB4638970.1 anthranilate phosphoribosyltransferase [Longimicrobium terrae]MBB6073209.1 anthranilate phosphoribosyltransferase [Longimicrobium terrae]NNC32338.1 anthranilate phosphoribosyltransferase [Longimicrobium terrae]
MSADLNLLDADLTELIRRAADRPLTADEAERAFGEVMDGRASPVQMAALLVAIRVRGATPQEVAGGVRALRRAMVPVHAPPEGLVDTCGTGGGSLTTFNISTAAALLAAGAGVRVAKHGNRSFTSKCGSADVLEALGVRLELDPEREARVLEEVGIVFMFAPLHHPAMRHIGPIRRELAMPTLMNILGPVTNPAGAKRQVVGVNDPALLPLIAGALQELGHDRALVVHGQPGLDEISPLGTTEVMELNAGQVTRRTFDPVAELGWPRFEVAGLEGGERDENAAKVQGVLRGTVGGSARAATVLNAGAAIYVSGMTDTLVAGVAIAESTLESGAGYHKLQQLRDATRG